MLQVVRECASSCCGGGACFGVDGVGAVFGGGPVICGGGSKPGKNPYDVA